MRNHCSVGYIICFPCNMFSQYTSMILTLDCVFLDFSLHYSSLHTIKVSFRFIVLLCSAEPQKALCWPWLIWGLVQALYLLVKLWDIYLQYYTLGGGAGLQIWEFDRWPARFTALPLNVCHSVGILLLICGPLELTCVFVLVLGNRAGYQPYCVCSTE